MYAQRSYIDQAKELDIEYRLNTMVMDISHEKVVTAMNREEGLFEIQAKAVYSPWDAGSVPGAH